MSASIASAGPRSIISIMSGRPAGTANDVHSSAIPQAAWAALDRPAGRLVYARSVDDERALDDLVRLAERLGIEVRSRVLRGTPGSGSGLCRVRGQWVVILNSHGFTACLLKR